MYEECVIQGRLIEDVVYDVTKAGAEYAILRVVVERPYRKRGKFTYFSVFAYGDQIRMIRERACIGATVFCAGTHRADFDTGGPQMRMGDREMLATYDIAARVVEITDGLGARENLPDEREHNCTMQLVNGGAR